MKFYELLLELTDKETNNVNRIQRTTDDFGTLFKKERTIIKTMKMTDDIMLKQYNLIRSNNKTDVENRKDHIYKQLEVEIKKQNKKVKEVDVNNNKAILDDGREMKLTKLISRLNSENDYYIVISHNPIDVAGMSTDKNWHSCMDIRQGSYKSQPFKEVKEGGMVAYLMLGKTRDMEKVMNDHKENGLFQQNAVSRISIRRFEGMTKKKYMVAKDEFIFKPERQCYYAVGATEVVMNKIKFLEEVESKLEESNQQTSDFELFNYKMKGRSYSDTHEFKNGKLPYYNKRVINKISNSEQIKLIKKSKFGEPFKLIDNPSEDVVIAAIKNKASNITYYKKDLTDKIIDTLIKKDSLTALNEYFRQRNITPTEKQFMQMIKNDPDSAAKNIVIHFKDKINDKILKYAINQNPHLTRYLKNIDDEMRQYVYKQAYNLYLQYHDEKTAKDMAKNQIDKIT